MRLLNTALWVGLVLLLGCCVNLDAQTNNLPAPVQSASSGGDGQGCNATQMTNTVTLNDRIAGSVSWQDACSGGITATVVSDGCTGAGGTPQNYTMSTATSLGVGAGQCLYSQMFDAKVNNSCRPTLITTPDISADNCSILPAELPSTLIPDGAVQVTTYSATPSSVSTSATTAKNGDLALAASVSSAHTVGLQAASPPAQFAASASGQVDSLLSWVNCGLAGTCSVTHSTDINQFYVNEVQAYKLSSQSIATTALPDAVSGGTYSATLVSQGGTIAPTWTVTVGSLPTGITLNSSTGALSATTVSGTTQSFTVSDGVATQALTLKVDAAFGVPSLGATVPGSVGTSWTVPGVFAGDVICVAGQMFDSASFDGYIEPTSELSGTLGDSVYVHECPYSGGRTSGLALYCSKTTSPGTDTISFAHNGVGSPIGALAFSIHNAQPVIDCGASATIAKAQVSLTLTTGTFTPAQPSELLLAVASVCQTVGSTTLTVNSPFTSLTQANGGLVCSLQQYSTETVSSVSGVTATAAATNLPSGGGAGGNQTDSITVWGFRAGALVTPTFLGEKRRRRF